MRFDDEGGQRDRHDATGSSGDSPIPMGPKLGLRVSIQIEPELAEPREAAPIQAVWTPATSAPFEYDPYGVRPQPENTPFAEPIWDIAWGFSAPAPSCSDHPSRRCTCGGTLPPGRWIETDAVEYVDDATKYPLAPRDSEGEDEFPPPPVSPDQE